MTWNRKAILNVAASGRFSSDRTIAEYARDIWVGSLGLVHRCQQHKRGNVLEHLPESLRPSVCRALLDAWDAPTAEFAHRQLERLAHSLEREHPGAAASIREGLEETLTLLRLGTSRALYRTLRTTNPIENLNGSIAHYTRNVKRWRGGQMMMRWVSAALLETETRFCRLRGYRDMAGSSLLSMLWIRPASRTRRSRRLSQPRKEPSSSKFNTKRTSPVMSAPADSRSLHQCSRPHNVRYVGGFSPSASTAAVTSSRRGRIWSGMWA
jgi:hypothetical protein